MAVISALDLPAQGSGHTGKSPGGSSSPSADPSPGWESPLLCPPLRLRPEEVAWEGSFVPVLLYPGLLCHQAHGDLAAPSTSPAMAPTLLWQTQRESPSPAAPGLLPAPAEPGAARWGDPFEPPPVGRGGRGGAMLKAWAEI